MPTMNFQFRIYPSNKQQVRLFRQFDICRGLYNDLLELCRKEYQETGKTLGRFDLNKAITQMKNDNAGLKAVHSQVLQNCADSLHKAFTHFFRRVTG